MKNQDIEQRAEEYLKGFKYASLDEVGGLREGYLTAMSEERERGKRFNVWAFKNDYSFWPETEKWSSVQGEWVEYNDLFDLFLENEEEEKALNN